MRHQYLPLAILQFCLRNNLKKSRQGLGNHKRLNKSERHFMKANIFITAVLLFTSTLALASSFPDEQAEVEAFLSAHTVSRVTNYCRTDFLNCRSLVQYKNISTGLNVDSFEDRFIASTNGRAVSFRSFFMKQSNGKFNVYAQNELTNQVNIDTVESQNQDVTISFDSNNLPTLPFKFTVVGTNPVEYKLDTLTYTMTEATFNRNTPSDSSDDFVVPFHSQTTH